MNQIIPHKINNSTDDTINVKKIGNKIIINANKINLSTMIICYGTQMFKTVLYLSKDLLHHLCVDYTFCKLDRLVLLEVLNLLMLLPVSFLLSEK